MHKVFILLIRCYQVLISPFTQASCRFEPTCSNYAIKAFEKHGFFKGFVLTFKRLIRCHPWGGFGFDPVPEKKDK